MFLIVLVAIAAVVLVIWFKGQASLINESSIRTSRPAPVRKPDAAQPAAVIPLTTDTQELDAISVGDVDAEFQNIDADVNSL